MFCASGTVDAKLSVEPLDDDGFDDVDVAATLFVVSGDGALISASN